jgi:hypothetical protein
LLRGVALRSLFQIVSLVLLTTLAGNRFAFYASPLSACLTGLEALPILPHPDQLDADVFWIVGYLGSILTG